MIKCNETYQKLKLLKSETKLEREKFTWDEEETSYTHIRDPNHIMQRKTLFKVQDIHWHSKDIVVSRIDSYNKYKDHFYDMLKFLEMTLKPITKYLVVFHNDFLNLVNLNIKNMIFFGETIIENGISKYEGSLRASQFGFLTVLFCTISIDFIVRI